ncbi:Polar amino acid transport system permease protein OS=Castellaniella defragrans OX=75697 GN=HNR28_002471 PE=3 SV=1 [Castellaniella defragrans]
MTTLGFEHIWLFINGVGWTLFLTLLGFAGGIIGGVVIALARVSENPIARHSANVFIEIFRGTPLLIQLFVAYYGVGLLGVSVSPWAAVAIGLTLNASAFLGNIWRGSIQALPTGQAEASYALGMSYWSRMIHVILPQALRSAMPATVGFMVQLLKGTSLAAIVGFTELSRTGTIIANLTYQPMQVYGIIAILYFLLCWPLSRFGRNLERKLSRATA